MTSYAPILKGKAGEFSAWRQIGADTRDATRPMFEVVPTGTADGDLRTFVRGIANRWPGGIATVDTGALDQTIAVGGGPNGPVMWTAEGLAAGGVSMRPVLHAGDPSPVIAEVVAAVDLHGKGVTLRIGSDDADPLDEASDAEDALDESGLETAAVHLVIDMRAVTSPREVAGATPPAVDAVNWAAATGPWASVAVVSGAFPSSISSLPKGVATALRRFDADLFDAVAASAGTPIDYGDYGVAAPAMPGQAFRGPLPSLRYTAQRDWDVYREERALPGNESFFTLCSRVVGSPAWAGGSFSWGDGEIARCATSVGGPGNATQWRAYATSHHVAHVTHRLASHGAP